MVYINYTFLLENGNKRVVTVKDLKENVSDSEILSLAGTFMNKNSQHQGSKFMELQGCKKYTLEVEEVSLP